ncbi:MAG TPA: hypothetical protein VJH34_00715 [archaeon]|nr:hypothetical protein [archaeon]
MAVISRNIIKKAKELVESNRVTRDAEGYKRIHFKVIGDSEEHIVIYNKEKKTYECECSWATLKHRICSHALASMMINGDYKED